jgi:cytoskeletal protein CcmA (bactofilin family)
VVAEELTIGGEVKGTIHANRVKLNATAVVEGDIFHRSLSIEENARFEGLSKREDSAVDFPRPAIQDNFPTAVAAVQGTWKTNGAPSHDGRSAAGET